MWLLFDFVIFRTLVVRLSMCTEWDNVNKLSYLHDYIVYVYMKFMLNIQWIEFSWQNAFFSESVTYIKQGMANIIVTLQTWLNLYVINWWKSVGHFNMVVCIIWCIIIFGVKFIEMKAKSMYIWFQSILNIEVCFFSNYHLLFSLHVLITEIYLHLCLPWI